MKDIEPLEVKHGDKTMLVFIPPMGDPVHDKDLKQWQQEKTLDDMRKQPGTEKPNATRKETGKALNEYMKWYKKNKDSVNKRYF